MRAAYFRSPFDVEILKVKTPSPSKGEVLVRVVACAICASDAGIIEGGNPNPGHEIGGVVEKVGDNVKGVSVGDRVTLYWKIGCGECAYCKEGYDVHCDSPRFTLWNGYSEYVVAVANACLPLPDSISLMEGSLLTDTIGTPLTAVKGANVYEKSVAVWGCGPLGLMGIQLCKIYGAKIVIAIEPIEFRRLKAKELGADVVINPKVEEPVEKLRELCPPLGVSASICATPALGVAKVALNATAPEGRLISIAGEPSGDMRHRWLYRVHYFKREYYKEIATIAGEGKVALREMITHSFPLEDIGKAFHMRFKRKEETLKVVVLTGEGAE